MWQVEYNYKTSCEATQDASHAFSKVMLYNCVCMQMHEYTNAPWNWVYSYENGLLFNQRKLYVRKTETINLNNNTLFGLILRLTLYKYMWPG